MKILLRNKGQKGWNTVSSFSYKDEKELQKLLTESPDLIPSRDLREGAGDLVAVVREFPLTIGSVDLLAFSRDGDIAIIECKLADNPEGKRKVIGQVLEYGSAIWGMSYADMDQKNKLRTGKSLADFVRDEVNDPSWDEETFRTNIEEHLQEGNFILVIVVDEINENLTQIIRFLNACGNPKFSFAALEMRRFHSGSTEVLVPRVDGDYRPPSLRDPSERISWTKDLILTDAKAKLKSQALDIFLDLYKFIEEYSQDGAGLGTGKQNGSVTFYYKKGNVRSSVFSIFTHGDLAINIGFMKNIFSPEVVQNFKDGLEKMNPFRSINTGEKYYHIIKLGTDLNQLEDLEKFKQSVLSLRDKL